MKLSMARAGTAMHTATTAPSLPPLSMVSAVDCCSEVGWGAEGDVNDEGVVSLEGRG